MSMLKETDRYTFVDRITLGYVTFVGLLVLLLHGTVVPHWPMYVAAHGLGVVLILALIRWQAAFPANRALQFVRQFYPLFLFGPLYGETAQFNHMLFPGFLDPVILRLEARVFGTQPGVAFMDSLPYRSVSELLYAAYFSYYLMIAGVALALYLRDRRQFAHYVAVTCVVFYPCYLCYILFPVVGPMILAGHIPGYQLPSDLQLATPLTVPAVLQGGPFFRLMALVYVPFEAPGASFPSSHVAVAIVTVYFSFKYLRAVRWPHLAVMVLLCAATVYGRYHYVADVLAGAATAALLIPLGNWLYFRSARTASSPAVLNRAPSSSAVGLRLG